MKQWNWMRPVLWAAVTVVAVPGWAAAEDPGLTVLSFLNIGAGARPASLGEAYVAVADDATANYWNPAGLLRIPRNDVVGTHNEWIQDLRQEFVAVGFHRGRHAFGVSFVGLYTDDIVQRDETGEQIGSFGFSDNAFSASYAFQAMQSLGLGGTIRYSRESLVGVEEGDFVLSGFSFDLGSTWTTPLDGLTAAAVVRNIGGKASYDFDGAQEFDLPTGLQAGLAYQLMNLQGGGITLSGDFLSIRGENASLRFGAEYAFRGQFLLGAGIKSGLENENVSFGVGYDNRIRAHYAFLPISNDLGSSHRISVGYSW